MRSYTLLVMGCNMKLLEKDLENHILDFLNLLPNCFVFKVQTTGFFDTKRRVFRKNLSKHIIKGTSDIVGVINGRMIAIEVKSKQGMVRFLRSPGEREKNQRAFLDKVIACGGIGICAASLEEVLMQMK